MHLTHFLLKPERSLVNPHTVVIDAGAIILGHLLGRPFASVKEQDRFAALDVSAKYNSLADAVVKFVEACLPNRSHRPPHVVIVHGGCPPRALVPHHRRLSYMSAIARRTEGVTNDTTDALPTSTFYEHVQVQLLSKLNAMAIAVVQEPWIDAAVQRAVSETHREGIVRFIGTCDETVLHALHAHMRMGAGARIFQFCANAAEANATAPVTAVLDAAKVHRLQPSWQSLVPALVLSGAAGFLPPLNESSASEEGVIDLAAQLQRCGGDVRRVCKEIARYRRPYANGPARAIASARCADPWANCMTTVKQNDHKRINLETQSAVMSADVAQAAQWRVMYYKLLFGQTQTQDVAAQAAHAYLAVLNWAVGYIMGNAKRDRNASPMYVFGYAPLAADIGAALTLMPSTDLGSVSALDPVLYKICVTHPDTGGHKLHRAADATAHEDGPHEEPSADAAASALAFSNHVRYACVDLFPAATTATTFLKSSLWDCVPNIPSMDTERISQAARRIKATYSPQAESQPSNCILRRLL